MVNLNQVDWSTLPRPEDDGAASHLAGMTLKHVPLPATDESQVDLVSLQGQVVLYIYPMTGRPDVHLPDGWDGDVPVDVETLKKGGVASPEP